jgi:phosphohistidine swiveling domain-containing protein
MARWLLSGQNPQETFGVPYPISASYIVESAAQRGLGHIIATLAGGTDRLDTSLPLMLSVQGRIFVNVHYLTYNAAVVTPFDAGSIGVPKGLVTSQRKPLLPTRLLLPFRFGRSYRQTMRNYRQVIPRYRKTLNEIYWRLRDCDPCHPTDQDLAQTGRLFGSSTLTDMIAFSSVFPFLAFLNMGVLGWVNRKAPALLNLLVGRGTSTAQLGERMWELRQVAVQCGAETVDLLRRGEMDLAKYRIIPEAAPLLEASKRFIRTYGHRAFRYASEFEATRLADQPELALLTIGGLLEESEPPAVRAEAARQLGYQTLHKMDPFRRLFWQRILKWGSTLIERREECRDTLELQNATYGLAATVLSRHHFPNQPPDYLWLYTFEEFLSFGQSRGQKRVAPEEIERRRAELERNRRQAAPPELVWYDPKTKAWWPVQEAEAEKRALTSEGRLQGIGASAGSGPVEGIALVTDSAQQAAERLLEISGPVVLVTHVTDPVWSSLFRRLTAVVTEMGGAISHAAIVARENGIPAVVGVPEATRWIRDGQWVRVDGTTGTVEVVQNHPQSFSGPSHQRTESIAKQEVMYGNSNGQTR